MFLKRVYNHIRRLYIEKSGPETQINYYRRLGMKIGEKCIFGGIKYTNEAYLIEIGDHVTMAGGTTFITHDAGLWCFSDDVPEYDIFGKIIIGDNVMIGMNSIFLPNTVIGNNTIIGAGSVVRGKFPDNSLIMGNPAKIVSNLNVQKFLYAQHPNRLKTARLSDKEKMPIVKKHFGIE